VINDVAVQLPCPLEAIVVVNLPSCYGGAYLWDYDKVTEYFNSQGQKSVAYRPLSINDRKLEVVGIKNSVHLGQVQIGIASPIYIGQGEKIVISLNNTEIPLPVQIDGEPWLQSPSTIEISYLRQSVMFACKDKAHKTLELGKME